MTRTLLTCFFAAATMAATAGLAEAKQVRFVGPHPITGERGAFCYIEVPHVHVYAPAHAEVLYRDHDGANYFVGDPVPYGYEGPKHAYYGPHPVTVDVTIGEVDVDDDDTEYCYLNGPHYHYYVPPPEARFAIKGGVYWYAGDLPEEFRVERPRFIKVNAIYKPLVYARPVVVVAPPPEYHGPIIEVVEEVEVAEVEVAAPAVVVPAPRVRAGVGAGAHAGFAAGMHAGFEVGVALPSVVVTTPGVVVEEHHHHVVAPSRVKVRHHRHGRGRWKHRGDD